MCPSMNFTMNMAVDRTSYMSTLIVSTSGGYWGKLEGMSIADIKRVYPAEIPMWMDAVGWMNPTGAANLYAGRAATTAYASPHGSGNSSPLNVCFLDGHVKAMALTAWVTTLQNAAPPY